MEGILQNDRINVVIGLHHFRQCLFIGTVHPVDHPYIPRLAVIPFKEAPGDRLIQV